MVNCRIRGICKSGICYGNPPFPWNLLETQEESFWLCSHDCTISAGLIEWQNTQLMPLNACSMHTQYLQPEGRKKKASCSQLLDVASHTNCSPISLIFIQLTIHNPIFFSISFLQINTSFSSSMKRSKEKFIKWWLGSIIFTVIFQINQVKNALGVQDVASDGLSVMSEREKEDGLRAVEICLMMWKQSFSPASFLMSQLSMGATTNTLSHYGLLGKVFSWVCTITKNTSTCNIVD